MPKKHRPEDDILILTTPQGQKSYGTSTPKINRRRLVAHYMLCGYSVRETVLMLEDRYGIKISVTVVADDFRTLKKAWQEEALLTTNEHMVKELGKLENLETIALHGLEERKLDTKDFLTEMTRIMKRRAAMLGIDKAEKIELHDKRTSDLDDAELEAIITSSKKRKSA